MKSRKLDLNKLAKVGGIVAAVALGLFATDTFAAAAGGGGGDTIGTIAARITESFTSLGQLILAIAFVGGLGFTMAAIFKFKQHKDNPTQIPLGTPIAMLAIGIVLMFLPGIITPAGTTLFGASASSAGGGLTGQAGLATLPGQGSSAPANP
jgi:intracellular multiplication protein IcmD